VGAPDPSPRERPEASPVECIDLDPIRAPFDDPARYLRRREAGRARVGKALGERWALRRVLTACGPIHSVLDCPCGPGRLFDLWASRGMTVLGLDRSPAMGVAGRSRLVELGARGHVMRATVEDLDRLGLPRVDLVASVRFVYYFDARARVALLERLARRSARWLLVQYKTNDTWKGRRNQRRGRNQGKHFLSHTEIRRELGAAGLTLVAFEPHGSLSDRALALARVRRP
jgi:SAM-dependent methyltransferase